MTYKEPLGDPATKNSDENPERQNNNFELLRKRKSSSDRLRRITKGIGPWDTRGCNFTPGGPRPRPQSKVKDTSLSFLNSGVDPEVKNDSTPSTSWNYDQWLNITLTKSSVGRPISPGSVDPHKSVVSRRGGSLKSSVISTSTHTGWKGTNPYVTNREFQPSTNCCPEGHVSLGNSIFSFFFFGFRLNPIVSI